MKGISKKLIALLIALSFVSLLFGCGDKTKNVSSYEYDGSMYEESNDYVNNYGYNYFLKNNENQEKLYKDAYYRCVDFKNKKINLKTSNYAPLFEAVCADYNLTLDQTREVFDVLVYENPMFYFLSEIDYEDDGDRITLETTKDYYLYSDRVKYDKIISDGLKKFDEAIYNIEDEFEKVYFIYNYISDRMEYCEEDEGDLYYAHNIIGFFSNGEGVCETYSKTFILLCNRCGIECIPAYSIDHVWNMAKIENKWFMFDVTKDIFGCSEAYYFQLNQETPEFDGTMIPAPKTAVSSLSVREFVLTENGEELYRSHCIDNVYEHFNGGDYVVYLDTTGATRDDEKIFYIAEINPNFNTLTISGTDDNTDPDGFIAKFDATILISEGFTVPKDMQFRKVHYDSSIVYQNPQNDMHARIYVPIGVTVIVTANARHNYVGVEEIVDKDDYSLRGRIIYVVD